MIATVDSVTIAGSRVPLGPGDLDALTVDVGPAPGNLAVVLDMPDVTANHAPEIAELLADRIRGIPRRWDVRFAGMADACTGSSGNRSLTGIFGRSTRTAATLWRRQGA